jgi:hypothetical protein
MGRHEASDDASWDPVVSAAKVVSGTLTERPRNGGAHSVERPRRGSLGWPGPEPDRESVLGWPGDL